MHFGFFLSAVRGVIKRVRKICITFIISSYCMFGKSNKYENRLKLFFETTLSIGFYFRVKCFMPFLTDVSIIPINQNF